MPAKRVVADRAFTLIELMVVVVLMAIIAAVIVPWVISRAQKSRADAPGAESVNIAQAPPSVVSVAEDGRELRAVKVVSSTVAVELEVKPVLEGASVRSRYVAAFRGTFVFEPLSARTGAEQVCGDTSSSNCAAARARAEQECGTASSVDCRAARAQVEQVCSADCSKAGEALSLYFPFPPGATEVRGVSLSLRGEDGVFREPEDVRYAADGIRWRGRAPSAREIVAVVGYQAVGRDAFRYDIAGKERTGRVWFGVDVRGGEAIVPAGSLEPAEVGDARIVWRFEKMISARPIMLELPAGSSPLGRAILLLRLAALAVLLFGAGYWYLGEGMRPGHLDSFRWSHFLLLALNYSLYFAIAAVLFFWIPVWLAAIAAGAISLPLLAVHIARIADRHFALTRALPLAMFTLAVTMAAALIEERRPLVFLGAAIAVIAFLTLTHGRFIAARRAQKDRRARKAAADVLSKVLAAGEAARGTAVRALEEHARGAEVERRVLSDRLARWARVTAESPEDVKQIDELRLSVERATAELVLGEKTFREAVARWEHDELQALAAKALAEAHAKKAEHARHCAACGARVAADARFCGSCGAIRSAELACNTCGKVTRLPSQVLRKRWTDIALCCDACGTTLQPAT